LHCAEAREPRGDEGMRPSVLVERSLHLQVSYTILHMVTYVDSTTLRVGDLLYADLSPDGNLNPTRNAVLR